MKNHLISRVSELQNMKKVITKIYDYEIQNENDSIMSKCSKYKLLQTNLKKNFCKLQKSLDKTHQTRKLKNINLKQFGLTDYSNC